MYILSVNVQFQVFLDVLILKVADRLELHVIMLSNAGEALEYTYCLCQ